MIDLAGDPRAPGDGASPTAAPSASALRSTPSRAATARSNGSSASRAWCRATKSANARMLPDGSVIIHVGTQNHGQGHETTSAQIAAHELTIDPALHFHPLRRHRDLAVRLRHLWLALDRVRRRRGGALLPDADREDPAKSARICCRPTSPTRASRAARCTAPPAASAFAEIAYAANVRQEHLPAGMEPLLDVTGTYEPTETGGVFAYGTHAVVVAVEPDTGVVEILDYAVSEDCGTMINPMIVDGQVQGGIAQGIGTALYEEIPYDEIGQPLATTFGDYMMPCAPEIPTVRIAHLVHPALATEYGVKGLGEGGAIAPPAAIANAVADAFRGIGASFNETPLTPRRVSEAVERARRAKAPASNPAARARGMKPAPFEYIRPKSVAEASVALGRRGRQHGGHRRRPVAAADAQPAGRADRPAGRHQPARRSQDRDGNARQPLARRAHHPRRHRGRQDPRHLRRPDAAHRRPDLLPRDPQPRHHRRQRGAGRSRRRLAVLPDRARRQRADRRPQRRAHGTRRRFHPGLLRDDAHHRRHHHGLRHSGAEGAAALGLRQGRAQERRIRPFDRARHRRKARMARSRWCSAPRARVPVCCPRRRTSFRFPRLRRSSCARPSRRTSTRISPASTPIRSECTRRTSCVPRGTCGPNDCDHRRTEWREGQRRRGAASDAGRLPARPLRADRDASRLRAWRLRRLHRGGGRGGDALVPDRSPSCPTAARS